MINEYWAIAPRYYKVIVVSAIAAMAIGVVITIIGAMAKSNGTMVAGLPFIGLGAVLHLAGIAIRARGVRRLVKERAARNTLLK